MQWCVTRVVVVYRTDVLVEWWCVKLRVLPLGSGKRAVLHSNSNRRMGSFSKILPYSCYELGHCWKHSCSSASFEICIIGFIESLKIYGVVYLLTGLVNAQKISMKYGKKLLKDYLTSVCFLTVNAFGYIGSYCVVR
ncbi:Transmembrane protein 135 [Portunus trituberculatus]|uniref:Transmembrane protein 135 n=1 Tax=Portunus trituberculatus TaxID=210409 RepID=A0A5B7CVN5_PORTR|nr:Transmembrane protein 135 [Portunus trituberculatus]